MSRVYHVVSINEQSGRKVYMTGDPVTHNEGCAIMSKISNVRGRRVQLEETEPGMKIAAYVNVYDYGTGELIERGNVSETLAAASAEDETGAVFAWKDGAIWQYVAPCDVDRYRANLNREVRTVYFD